MNPALFSAAFTQYTKKTKLHYDTSSFHSYPAQPTIRMHQYNIMYRLAVVSASQLPGYLSARVSTSFVRVAMHSFLSIQHRAFITTTLVCEGN